MNNIWKKFWPFVAVLLFWLVFAIVVVSFCSCNRELRKEIEQLREELARQQQYVPLQRDTIRDSVYMVTQKIVEVERIKEVLTAEDRDLLRDMGTKVSAIESYQKIGMRTEASVALNSGAVGTDDACNGQSDSKSDDGHDSLLTYNDAWIDFKYNTLTNNLRFRFRDSLSIAVEKEYKKRFLWWKWGVKGYQVKAVSFNPYTTIRYNTFVKKGR